MSNYIRRLNEQDFQDVKAMDTGIEDDYVIRIFHRLLDDNNRLFGLFHKESLVSIAGYSVYARKYAMLGRLRSDRRYRGNDFSTTLVKYTMKEVLKHPAITWVGGNTQEENLAGRRVLEKAGLQPFITLYGATTKDVSKLETGARPWAKVHNLNRKKELVYKGYLDNSSIFPYQCYYPFPASWELFTDENLEAWSFYENNNQDRFLIMKEDQKKNVYLHVIYPWNDMVHQEGLWETISDNYQQLAMQTMEATYVWMDLTKEEAKLLPDNHPFTLASPWILFGTAK
ncbi:GNAT family N-acetyltransferase [Oceanobacillus kapialis]|uniref:GNAT family N-acetyltransferase n=1 Tax=Oceanobacillus kapialis TaxID=481353 RepID=A0ABW5Q4U8_9BACI